MTGDLGISIASNDPAVAMLTVAADHHNFYDTTHGGAVFAVADAALEAAVAGGPSFTVLDEYLTLTAATAAGDVLSARAEPMTSGRTLGTYRVTVTRGDDRVVATLIATVRRDRG